jgi:hypothetical protein
MSAVSECGGRQWRLLRIREIFAWLARSDARPRRAIGLDPAVTPAYLLRDIGLLDGYGPSLRRPERLPPGAPFDPYR